MSGHNNTAVKETRTESKHSTTMKQHAQHDVEQNFSITECQKKSTVAHLSTSYGEIGKDAVLLILVSRVCL